MSALLVAGLVLGSLIVTAGLALLVVSRLPVDYFTRPRRQPLSTVRPPVLRVALIVLKNVAGWLLIALGLVMSVPGVPGQGLLTVLIGLLLVDFPGKFRLERSLMRRRGVASAVNWLRRKLGKSPLELPSAA